MNLYVPSRACTDKDSDDEGGLWNCNPETALSPRTALCTEDKTEERCIGHSCHNQKYLITDWEYDWEKDNCCALGVIAHRRNGNWEIVSEEQRLDCEDRSSG